MKHGYTNDTEQLGDTVLKRYAGPDFPARAHSEQRALTALAGAFPVPNVVATSDDSLTTDLVAGTHGQELMDAGHAPEVLAECGRTLRLLHSIDPAILGTGQTDGVIQHGDFGPNNVLFTTDPVQVAAVVDWEFSGVGPAITDLAWCEWIVRMHHPDASGALGHFFTAYGARPPWPERQAEMLRRCQWLEDFCRRWAPDHPGITHWQARHRTTAAWTELPA